MLMSLVITPDLWSSRIPICYLCVKSVQTFTGWRCLCGPAHLLPWRYNSPYIYFIIIVLYNNIIILYNSIYLYFCTAAYVSTLNSFTKGTKNWKPRVGSPCIRTQYFPPLRCLCWVFGHSNCRAKQWSIGPHMADELTQTVLVPLQLDYSKECFLNILLTWQLASPKARDQQETRQEAKNLLQYILRDHIPSFPQEYPIGFTDRSYSICGKIIWKDEGDGNSWSHPGGLLGDWLLRTVWSA